MTLQKSISTYFYCIVISILLVPFVTFGQEGEESTLVITGVSPIILERGQIEITNNSFLVSYWNKLRILDLSGSALTNTYRLSQFQNTTSIYYGFSDNRRWDLGADVTYSRQRWDDVARSSPFKVFSSDAISKGGISYLGLKFRAQPFTSMPELTLQTSVRIPIANGDQLRRDLSADRMQISLFSTYFKRTGLATSYLLQGGWTFSVPKTIEETNSKIQGLHTLALGGYLAFDVFNQSIYVIPGMAYSGSFQQSAKSSRILQRSHAVLGNLVVQFQINSSLSLSLQQSYPLLFESYLPNVKFERRSFLSSAIALRLLI